jgi:hypothetical protein
MILKPISYWYHQTFLVLYNPEMVWAAKGYIFIKMNPVFPLDSKALEYLSGDFLQFRHRLENEECSVP